MDHDFDAAIADIDYAEMIKEQTYQAAIFALKFTKASLSVEVSRKMMNRAKGVICAEIPTETQIITEQFKAMCQQLAKEVGNG